jgi:hypothetical protein
MALLGMTVGNDVLSENIHAETLFLLFPGEPRRIIFFEISMLEKKLPVEISAIIGSPRFPWSKLVEMRFPVKILLREPYC